MTGVLYYYTVCGKSTLVVSRRLVSRNIRLILESVAPYISSTNNGMRCMYAV